MNEFFLHFFQRFRGFLLWLWKQDGTSAERARGIAVGVFSGCFPFFGFQTFFGIMLASLCKGNRLLAAAGTWISNPLTYFPLYWLNYKIGSYFLYNDQILQISRQINRKELWSQGWLFSSRLLLGCTLVGSVLGVISGLVSYFLIKVFLDKRSL